MICGFSLGNLHVGLEVVNGTFCNASDFISAVPFFGITLSDFFLDEVSDFKLTKGQQELLEVYKHLTKDDKKILVAYGKGLAKMME